jgi:hypothetical protein
MMQLQPIQTSQELRAAHYDGATRTLTVQLRGGQLWAYPDVSLDSYQTLMGGLYTDGMFANIERAGRLTKRLVPPEADPYAGLTPGERVREMRLTSDYGPRDSATRRQYDELQQRLRNLQTEPVEAQLAETNAQLALISIASQPDEITRLRNRAESLRAMLATAAPAIAQIELELDGVRDSYQRAQANEVQRTLQHQRRVHDAHLRLAELTNLIAAPPVIGHEEMQRSYAGDGIARAGQLRMANWKLERDGLREFLGLPPVKDEPTLATATAEWRAKLQQDAQATTGAPVEV